MTQLERITEPRKGLFRVSRTSTYHSDDPPCEGARRCETMSVDRRTVDDPAKLPRYSEDWYKRGTNHRVENGCICRDMGWGSDWFVDIPDVLEFVAKHGRCVVEMGNDGIWCIEIYDDYRE